MFERDAALKIFKAEQKLVYISLRLGQAASDLMN
ncbi:Hypothetical protein OINT_2000739 [Brucella intermedia LMG 3301]|uniref:Uncharacterized protein n=1 Tax=Brucella intermedia LMG 3301 TaxID=641118 RepID=C4WL45_9HYPH|nr:Hypothetical protein OINT_2000739 [Brucella intermedia LMG 3301]